MLVLRFKYKGERGWRVPPNIRIGKIELPIGLASVHLVLLSTAIVNLFTKQVATIAGLVFSFAFFFIFLVSENINKRKFRHVEQQMKEHFQLDHQETIEREAVQVRGGNVLVTVRDHNTLNHLRWTLEVTDTHEQDIVVMEARLTGYGSAEYDLAMEQIFSDYEQTFRLGQAWEAMPEPKRQFVFQLVRPDSTVETYRIGPHTPTMKTEDVHLVHKIWLDIKRIQGTEDIHHSDIVTLALTRLARDYNLDKDDVLKHLKRGVRGPMPKASPFVREPDTIDTQRRTDTDGDGDTRPERPMPPVTGPR